MSIYVRSWLIDLVAEGSTNKAFSPLVHHFSCTGRSGHWTGASLILRLAFGLLRRGFLDQDYLLLGSHCKLLVGNYCVISFLRGLLINHGTPPKTPAIQSKPFAPLGWWHLAKNQAP